MTKMTMKWKHNMIFVGSVECITACIWIPTTPSPNKNSYRCTGARSKAFGRITAPERGIRILRIFPKFRNDSSIKPKPNTHTICVYIKHENTCLRQLTMPFLTRKYFLIRCRRLFPDVLPPTLASFIDDDDRGIGLFLFFTDTQATDFCNIKSFVQLNCTETRVTIKLTHTQYTCRIGFWFVQVQNAMHD